MHCSHRRLLMLAVVLTLIALAAAASAQTSLASLRGKVSDEQGGVLPGATVTARQIETKDRKSTRLNSSHGSNSYAVFCLKKKVVESSVLARAPVCAAPHCRACSWLPVGLQVLYVFNIPGREIVDHEDLISRLEQRIGKMRADEARSPRDENPSPPHRPPGSLSKQCRRLTHARHPSYLLSGSRVFRKIAGCSETRHGGAGRSRRLYETYEDCQAPTEAGWVKRGLGANRGPCCRVQVANCPAILSVPTRQAYSRGPLG